MDEVDTCCICGNEMEDDEEGFHFCPFCECAQDEPAEPDDGAGYCAEPECMGQAVVGDLCRFHAEDC